MPAEYLGEGDRDIPHHWPQRHEGRMQDSFWKGETVAGCVTRECVSPPKPHTHTHITYTHTHGDGWRLAVGKGSGAVSLPSAPLVRQQVRCLPACEAAGCQHCMHRTASANACVGGRPHCWSRIQRKERLAENLSTSQPRSV